MELTRIQMLGFSFRQGSGSESVLAQGLLSLLGHGREGSKAEGAAVVRSGGSFWGLGPSCPPSLALTARVTTAGRDCHVTLVSHCKTSWSLQLSEILAPWAVSHRKMWNWILQGGENQECLYHMTDVEKKKIHNWVPLLKGKKKKKPHSWNGLCPFKGKTLTSGF